MENCWWSEEELIIVVLLLTPTIEVPVFADQLELIYINSVLKQDVVGMTCRNRWIIGADGERVREKSVQSARRDNDADESFSNLKKALCFDEAQGRMNGAPNETLMNHLHTNQNLIFKSWTESFFRCIKTSWNLNLML